MCRLLWRPSRHAGVPQLRELSARWPRRRCRTMHRNRTASSGSSAPDFRISMRFSGPAAFPGARASRFEVRRAPAKRRSRSGWRRRPRRTVRSSPGLTSPGASIRSRPLPAASASTGSSSSHRRRSTKGCQSPARSSPVGRSTSSSSICRRVRIPERARPAWPIVSGASPRSLAVRRRFSSRWSRPG
jgi:hypothetical protein